MIDLSHLSSSLSGGNSLVNCRRKISFFFVLFNLEEENNDNNSK
jgi:hypothetical protein